MNATLVAEEHRRGWRKINLQAGGFPAQQLPLHRQIPVPPAAFWGEHAEQTTLPGRRFFENRHNGNFDTATEGRFGGWRAAAAENHGARAFSGFRALRRGLSTAEQRHYSQWKIWPRAEELAKLQSLILLSLRRRAAELRFAALTPLSASLGRKNSALRRNRRAAARSGLQDACRRLNELRQTSAGKPKETGGGVRTRFRTGWTWKNNS